MIFDDSDAGDVFSRDAERSAFLVRSDNIPEMHHTL